MSQVEAAARVKIGLSAVKSLESGQGFVRRPASLGLVDEMLDWKTGSIYEVLRGGEPTPLEQELREQAAVQQQVPEVRGADAGAVALADRLPERVMRALENGRVVDTEVYEAGGARAITVIVRDVDNPRSSEDAERLRRQMVEWTRAQIDKD
jgi:hypothetical protein